MFSSGQTLSELSGAIEFGPRGTGRRRATEYRGRRIFGLSYTLAGGRSSPELLNASSGAGHITACYCSAVELEQMLLITNTMVMICHSVRRTRHLRRRSGTGTRAGSRRRIGATES
jgi:hypothetical protein